MNLQEFQKKHQLNYTVTKKLYFDKYPIKVKLAWNGSRFLVGRQRTKRGAISAGRKIPQWLKSSKHSEPTNVIIRGRKITINPIEFRQLYNYLQEHKADKMRVEDSYQCSTVHFYFGDFSSADIFLEHFPFKEKLIEVSIPHSTLVTGQIVVLKPITDAGYRYRVNLKDFVLYKNENHKDIGRIFKNFGDEIKLPQSFSNQLYKQWDEKRTQTYLTNKYFYTKDLSTVTYLVLALPNLVKSVNDLISHKDASWQSSMNK